MSGGLKDIELELSNFPPGSKDRLLLEKVFEKLGENFARKSVINKATEARQQRDEAMQKYFEKCIVRDAVQKAVAEQEHTMSLSREVHPFYLEEVRKVLPEDSINSAFCGLTEKDIPETSELQSSAFQKLVSEKLKDFFVSIIECTGGTVGDNWRQSFDEAMNEIKSKIDFYENSKKEALESQKQLKDIINLYHKELVKNLTSMKQLLDLYVEKLDFDATISERYMLHCCALVKKTELFQANLHLAMYNVKTLPALNHISSDLNRKEETLKKEKQDLAETLEKYSQLGEEYECLVNEIMDLSKKIEEEQHAINGLKNCMPENDNSGLE